MTPLVRPVVFAILLGASPASAAPPAQAQDANAQLRQLLLERRDTLSHLFGLVLDKIWIGSGNMTRVLLIQHDLLHANLDLCSTPQDRIGVLQKASDTAGKIYKRWQDAFTGNVVEVEQSKAAWLEIRIQLLREQTKQSGDVKRP